MNKQNKARVETIMMNAHTEGNGIKTALIPVDLCELIQFWRLSCIDGDVELKRVYLTKQWRTRVQNEQMDQCK